MEPGLTQTRTGLALTDLLRPVETTDKLPKEARCWTCPLCKEGLPQANMKRYQKALNIKWHMAKKHPKCKLNLTQLYRKARKVFKEEYKERYNEANKEAKQRMVDKSLQRLREKWGPLGHDMGQVKIKMATFWGKEPRKGAFKACRKCRITDKALAMQERKGTFKGKKVNLQCEGPEKAAYTRPNTFAWNRYVNANEANEQVMKEFFGVSQEEVEYRRKQRKALGDFAKPHKLMKRKKYNKGEAKIPKNILRSRRSVANWLKEEERGVVRRRRKTYKEGEKKRTRKSQAKPKAD